MRPVNKILNSGLEIFLSTILKTCWVTMIIILTDNYINIIMSVIFDLSMACRGYYLPKTPRFYIIFDYLDRQKIPVLDKYYKKEKGYN